jgi:hypothetical protein
MLTIGLKFHQYFLEEKESTCRQTKKAPTLEPRPFPIFGRLQSEGTEDSTGACESSRAAAESVSDNTDQGAFDSTCNSSCTTYDESTACSTDSSTAAAASYAASDTTGNTTEGCADRTVNNGAKLGYATDRTVAKFVGEKACDSSACSAHNNFAAGVVSAAASFGEGERVRRCSRSVLCCGLGSGGSHFGGLHWKSCGLNLHRNKSLYI